MLNQSKSPSGRHPQAQTYKQYPLRLGRPGIPPPKQQDSHRNKDSTIAGFPRFRQLTPELRLMIWKFALPGPRIIFINDDMTKCLAHIHRLAETVFLHTGVPRPISQDWDPRSWRSRQILCVVHRVQTKRTPKYHVDHADKFRQRKYTQTTLDAYLSVAHFRDSGPVVATGEGERRSETGAEDSRSRRLLQLQIHGVPISLRSPYAYREHEPEISDRLMLHYYNHGPCRILARNAGMPFLSVCYESREVVTRQYRPMFKAPCTDPHVHFDCRSDTLYLPRRMIAFEVKGRPAIVDYVLRTSNLEHYLDRCLSMRDRYAVKRLAIGRY